MPKTFDRYQTLHAVHFFILRRVARRAIVRSYQKALRNSARRYRRPRSGGGTPGSPKVLPCGYRGANRKPDRTYLRPEAQRPCEPSPCIVPFGRGAAPTERRPIDAPASAGASVGLFRGVAQQVEHWILIPTVAGSIPASLAKLQPKPSAARVRSQPYTVSGGATAPRTSSFRKRGDT